ncbi:MAG TPA: metal-dependent hydrolase, partial [Bacteroidia bacterium]|nr:metal-dependent hydrolase [Bacteroidia bacterium]
MQVTYYGHSCFLTEINGARILFDPFITPNELAKHIDINNIRCDYILISHGHFDHLIDAEVIAKQTGALLVSNWEIVNWYIKKGVTNTHPMNIGGHWMFDFGKVKCINAVHSSSMPDGSYGGQAMGFLIETPEGNFYYSGDTALNYDMKLIGEFKTMDVVFLPIGNNFTMGVDNAIIASDFINCDHVVGLHYDTFGYITINHDEAVEKFDAAGKKLHLIPIGNT